MPAAGAALTANATAAATALDRIVLAMYVSCCLNRIGWEYCFCSHAYVSRRSHTRHARRPGGTAQKHCLKR
ncbi:hypothetical protein GTC054_54910 [Burkholderia pseudomallei]|nr:hypothetical protein GTC054_54910 [Burkholderia pseudomallei]